MPLFSQSAGPCVVTVNPDETIPGLVVSLQVGTAPFQAMSIEDLGGLHDLAVRALAFAADQPAKPTKEEPPAVAQAETPPSV